MSKFNALFSQFGSVSKKAISGPKKLSHKVKFAKKVSEQIVRLEINKPWTTGAWAKVNPDGTVQVSLRFENRTMPVFGDSGDVMVCHDKASAIAFFNTAVELASKGEFDEMFESLKAQAKKKAA